MLTTIPVVASAYCDSKNLTATGTRVHTGTIAVDPRIIPLHSKIRILIRHTTDWIGQYVDLQSKSILYKAEDTGEKIKGARIDLWMPSCKSAIQWGMRPVNIALTTSIIITSKVHYKEIIPPDIAFWAPTK